MKRAYLGAALFVAVATAGPALAADDLPTFNDRGKDEKAFVAKVGDAVVRAARTIPSKIELDTYKFDDPKKGRKDLRIVMNWAGGLTKKKYASVIVVRIDVTDDKKWEVLNVDYKDDSISWGNPRQDRIQALVKKFNR